MAAKALVTPAKMIEMTIAGPATTWPESPLIAVPIAAKMPAPIMAPMPRAVSWTGPRERRRPPPTDPSAMHWSTVFRANSWLLSTGFLSRGVLGQLLRVDGHRCDVIDVPSITGRRRVEQVSHHPFRKLAAVARVPDGRSHLDAGDSTFGGNPEPDLVASAPGFTRCARRRKNRPPRRGGENITRIATRASAGIGPDARPGARASPASRTRTLPRPTRRAGAGPDRRRRRRRDDDGRRRHLDLDRLRRRDGDRGHGDGRCLWDVVRLCRGRCRQREPADRRPPSPSPSPSAAWARAAAACQPRGGAAQH